MNYGIGVRLSHSIYAQSFLRCCDKTVWVVGYSFPSQFLQCAIELFIPRFLPETPHPSLRLAGSACGPNGAASAASAIASLISRSQAAGVLGSGCFTVGLNPSVLNLPSTTAGKTVVGYLSKSRLFTTLPDTMIDT